MLRTIIDKYLAAGPHEIRFTYNRYGKPSLDAPAADDSLRFNLSHSRGIILYAFARGTEVGIDVEHICPDVAGEEIAERFFSPREVAALRLLPGEQRAEAFFGSGANAEIGR